MLKRTILIVLVFKTSSGPPSIGLLIASLREVCDGYFVAMETIGQMQKKMDGIRNMTSDELKQVSHNVYHTADTLS